VPKLKRSLKLEQSYTKRKVKKFACKIDAKLGLETFLVEKFPVENFLFPENFGEKFW